MNVTVYVPKSIEAILKAAAEQARVTPARFVQRLIKRELEGERRSFTAHIWVGPDEIGTTATDLDLPNHFVISTEYQDDDIWIGTGHGLARGRGAGYYPGARPPATGGASHEEPLGVMMLHGAKLAVEHANAAGGYRAREIPYELVVRNDNGLWGSERQRDRRSRLQREGLGHLRHHRRRQQPHRHRLEGRPLPGESVGPCSGADPLVGSGPRASEYSRQVVSTPAPTGRGQARVRARSRLPW